MNMMIKILGDFMRFFGVLLMVMGFVFVTGNDWRIAIISMGFTPFMIGSIIDMVIDVKEIRKNLKEIKQ